jgi:hydroxymethylbilane synthase
VTEWLTVDAMLPSPGQGALAVECRGDDNEIRELVQTLSHAPTEAALTAERAFLARLGAGCAAAVGAYATIDLDNQLTLRAMIGAADGRAVRGTETGTPASALEMGERLADQLLAAGGRELVAEGERWSVA